MSGLSNLIGITPGKRVLFLTKDLELITLKEQEYILNTINQQFFRKLLIRFVFYLRGVIKKVKRVST